MRALWATAAVAFAALALSGCSGDDGSTTDSSIDSEVHDDGNTAGTSGSADDGTPDGSGTGGPSGGQPVDGSNTPPAITLEANVTEGTVPFDVTFDLLGTDADGDLLSWTLDADGDGSADADGESLPANFTYTFDAEGNHTANFTVSDGTVEVTASAVVRALAAVAGDPQEDVVFEDAVVCLPTIVVNGELAGMAHTLTVEPGQTKLTIILEYADPSGVGANDLDLYVTDPAGTETSSAAAGPEPPMEIPNPKAGDWTVDIEGYSCIGDASYKVTADFA